MTQDNMSYVLSAALFALSCIFVPLFGLGGADCLWIGIFGLLLGYSEIYVLVAAFLGYIISLLAQGRKEPAPLIPYFAGSYAAYFAASLLGGGL